MVNLKKSTIEELENCIIEHCGYPVFAEGMECQTLDIALNLIRGKSTVDHLSMVLQGYDHNLNKIEE